MKNKKSIIITLILGLCIGLIALTYGAFTYTRQGTTNSKQITGDIYMHYSENINGINLSSVFPMTAQEARERNDNTFTFQITGKNTSETKDIYYKILLGYGENVNGRTRIRDDLLRFDLVELLPNNEEKYILYNDNFDSINNQIILKDRIEINTTSEITRTYRVRIWIDKEIKISDTDQDRDYTTSQYNNLFASVKVNAKGETTNVNYYNSFESAVTAINSENYTSSITRGNAKAGIYIDSDDNTTNLVLYDDVDVNDDITITEPVNINLYGNTINYHEGSNQYSTKITFNANSKIENGTIIGEDLKTGRGYQLSYSENINGVVKNIHFIRINDYDNYSIHANNNSNVRIESVVNEEGKFSAVQNSNVKVLNSEFIISNTNNIGLNSTCEIEDSRIYSRRMNVPVMNIITSSDKLIVTNSTIFADSPGCYVNGNNNLNYSLGIANSGTLIFNSGYVFGTHSAIQTNNGSKTYVYGGTFESTDHGGFYFVHGTSGVAYIENANINGISYPAEGTYRPNGTVSSSITSGSTTYTLEEAKSAFYSSGNLSPIYLVNCNLSAVGTQFFAMKSSSNTQNIYMSGCTFNNTSSNQFLRVDNTNGMKLYFGINNNFGNIGNIYKSGNIPFATAKQNGVIVETNADYKDIVRPE